MVPMWNEAAREVSFRVYLTDALRLAAENAARIGGGRLMRGRWADMLGRAPGPRAVSAVSGSRKESRGQKIGKGGLMNERLRAAGDADA